MKFSLVGTIGFVVDATVLYLGLGLGLGLRLGRILSYLAAVTTTWALNRRYTFADAHRRKPLPQWLRFASTQLAGAALNLGTYYMLIDSSALVRQAPVIGVAAGSLAGLVINYLVARRYVFRGTTLAAAAHRK
jgi:putative flippase GtrA